MAESPPNPTRYPPDLLEEAARAELEERGFVTTRHTSKRIGCSKRTVRRWLQNQDDWTATHVGGNTQVWFPESARRALVEYSIEDLDPAHERGIESKERVMFFPSRREVIVDNPSSNTKSSLSQIAHLVDSTEDGHLYKISTEDVWTAAVDSFDELRSTLKSIVGEDKWDPGFETRIQDDWERAHQFTLQTEVDPDSGRRYTTLEAVSEDVFENVAKRKLEYNDHYTEYIDETTMRLKNGSEGAVKEELYDAGYPTIDNRRLEEGASLQINLIDDINLRNYQKDWIEHFLDRRSGVFVGPSGSGKTVAAIGAITELEGETLIIVPNRELVQQWQEELLEKTTLRRYQVGQYHGGQKQIRPITVATYDTAAMSRHRKLFNERDWGLVVADECHHAVANTWKRFREIQSTARLGLSATPVRESGDAKEIFTLIGPPVGSAWGDLFADGWVAKPEVELMYIPWYSETARNRYERAEGTKRLIEAARNPLKKDAIEQLLKRHTDQKVLICVDWIIQGEEISEALSLPFIHGESKYDRRQELYEQFREGRVDTLVVSRVGDEGIDLPDAEIAILASTMGASRSQTGQRAGRTMRPMGDAQVYILLTKGSGEEEWGRESTQYLAEKGINVSKTELPHPKDLDA